MTVYSITPEMREAARAVLRAAVNAATPEAAVFVMLSDEVLNQLITAVMAASSISVTADTLDIRDTRTHGK